VTDTFVREALPEVVMPVNETVRSGDDLPR